MGFYQHVSFKEREEISRLLATGNSVRQISRQLGRNASTISRECRRADRNRLVYRALKAHKEAFWFSHRPHRRCKLQHNLPLRSYVLQKLHLRWSPQQIAKHLLQDYPEDAAMRISHETIYRYLYILGRGALKKEIVRSLRQRKPYRRHQAFHQEDQRGTLPEMISIEERPAEVADRSVPGHWEGDLLMGGAKTLSALGVLVERKTRFLLLVPLHKKDAESVRVAFAHAIRRLPQAIHKSLTYDQGSEMAHHRRFTMDTNMTVYFCHPHSPWERGTCENTNGLLRQYFPKGINFHKVSLKQIQEAEHQMNGRPRNVLNWRTPSEVLSEVLG